MSKSHTPLNTPLGKHSEAVSKYTPTLLCGIPRAPSRELLGLHGEQLPFDGVDIWNAYELSWLDTRGKPAVAMGTFRVPCRSPNLIESKSLKLYLNSLNQSCFDRKTDVQKLIEGDLSAVAGAKVNVELKTLDQMAMEPVSTCEGDSLDHQWVETNCYCPEPAFLCCVENEEVTETLNTHLLRSLCPVTGQPDWGSVIVRYHGAKIDRVGLLKYVISYREHPEFHEQCVERLFVDIMARCQPEKLSVTARYLRRGGLDINPLRSNYLSEADNTRLVRQ